MGKGYWNRDSVQCPMKQVVDVGQVRNQQRPENRPADTKSVCVSVTLTDGSAVQGKNKTKTCLASVRTGVLKNPGSNTHVPPPHTHQPPTPPVNDG